MNKRNIITAIGIPLVVLTFISYGILNDIALAAVQALPKIGGLINILCALYMVAVMVLLGGNNNKGKRG